MALLGVVEADAALVGVEEEEADVVVVVGVMSGAAAVVDTSTSTSVVSTTKPGVSSTLPLATAAALGSPSTSCSACISTMRAWRARYLLSRRWRSGGLTSDSGAG